MKSTFQAKPVTVIAWQYTSNNAEAEIEASFANWVKNHLPKNKQNIRGEIWCDNTFGIEKVTSYKQDWEIHDTFYLDDSNWFLYNTCTESFEVLSNEQFKQLYE